MFLFAARSARVDILRDANERHALLFETDDDLDQIAQTATKPVEFPDDERIAFTREIDGGF